MKIGWSTGFAEGYTCGMTTNSKEYDAAWRAKNPERRVLIQRRYNLKNRVLKNEKAHAYYEKNRERLLAAAHLRYADNLEKERVRIRAARKARPEWARDARRRRRARVLSVPGQYSRQEWTELVLAWGGRCAYCGEVGGRLDPDHRIPLSRAALSPTNAIANIVPCCPTCNSRKGSKTEAEYRSLLS